DLRRRYADLATLGAPVSLLSGAEAEARTGSAAFHGALFDQRAGVIQPLAFVRGLARAAAAAGAALHEESAVLRIDRTPSALWRVETDRGAVEAPALLLATNAYHAEAAGAPAPIATPVFYFQLATKPLSDNLRRSVLPGGEGAWDTAPVMSSFRLDGAGRLLIGGVGALDGPAGGVHRAWASRQLSRLFPQLADQPLESAVCGRIAMSADKLPKLQRLGPRGYSVFGYSGRGIGPGVTFGEAAAAALLSGDETGLPLAPIDRAAPPSRFASGAAFEAGAAAIHLFGARSPI
ncbi:MAG: FAD-binding oxidoreductase, partial [Pseudomonadota bacterium]